MIKKEIYDNALNMREKLYKQFKAFSKDLTIFYAIADLQDQLNEIRKEIKMAAKKTAKKTVKKATKSKAKK